jgi:hypothetical protein
MKTKLFFLLVIAATLISCSVKDTELNNCISFKKEFVTKVTAPLTAKPDESVAIEVQFVVNNGCGSFRRFIETGDLYSKTIEVEARYEGCYCIQIMMEITETYYFIAGSSGNYELKFRSGDNEFIIVNITVE